MPSIKDLYCSIEIGRSQQVLQEHGTTYGDGFVETFVAVPTSPKPFSVHLASSAYIAEGLAMYVFIDGVYQCNRNRHCLKNSGKTGQVLDRRSLVDFRARQKEEKQKGGSMIAREWRFEKLDLASADGAPRKCSRKIANNIGCIEVIVLRCKGDRTLSTAQLENCKSDKKEKFGFDGVNDVPDGHFGFDGSAREYHLHDRSVRPEVYETPSSDSSRPMPGFAYVHSHQVPHLPPPSVHGFPAGFPTHTAHRPTASVHGGHNDRRPTSAFSHQPHTRRRHSEAVQPNVAAQINVPPPLPGVEYGTGPIPRGPFPETQAELFHNRTPHSMHGEEIVDPERLRKIAADAYLQGQMDAERRNGTAKPQQHAHQPNLDKEGWPVDGNHTANQEAGWPTSHEDSDTCESSAWGTNDGNQNSAENRRGRSISANGWKSVKASSPITPHTKNAYEVPFPRGMVDDDDSSAESDTVTSPPTVTATGNGSRTQPSRAGKAKRSASRTENQAASWGDHARNAHSNKATSHHSPIRTGRQPSSSGIAPIPQAFLMQQNGNAHPLTPPPAYSVAMHGLFRKDRSSSQNSWGAKDSSTHPRLRPHKEAQDDSDWSNDNDEWNNTNPIEGRSGDPKAVPNNMPGSWNDEDEEDGAQKNDSWTEPQELGNQKWTMPWSWKPAIDNTPEVRQQHGVTWDVPEKTGLDDGSDDGWSDEGDNGWSPPQDTKNPMKQGDVWGNDNWNTSLDNTRSNIAQPVPTTDNQRSSTHPIQPSSLTTNPHWTTAPPPFPPTPLKKTWPTPQQLPPLPPQSHPHPQPATKLPTPHTHAFKPGKPTPYTHTINRPIYLDTLKHPYAVFRFKYRSRDYLKKILPGEVPDVEPVVEGKWGGKEGGGGKEMTGAERVKQRLEGVGKEKLKEEIVRLKKLVGREERKDRRDRKRKEKGRGNEDGEEVGILEMGVPGTWVGLDNGKQHGNAAVDEDEAKAPTLVRQWVGEQRSRHSSSLQSLSKPASVLGDWGGAGGNDAWGKKGSVHTMRSGDGAVGSGDGDGDEWGDQEWGKHDGDGDGVAAEAAGGGWDAGDDGGNGTW